PRVEWRRNSIARCEIYCAPPAARWSGKAAAATKSGTARSRSETLQCPSAFPADTPPMPFCVRLACPRRSDEVRHDAVRDAARGDQDFFAIWATACIAAI